jgi:hypothetical protein
MQVFKRLGRENLVLRALVCATTSIRGRERATPAALRQVTQPPKRRRVEKLLASAPVPIPIRGPWAVHSGLVPQIQNVLQRSNSECSP